MTVVTIIGIMGVLGILAVAVLVFKHVISFGMAVLFWVLVLSFVLGFYFWMRDGDDGYGAAPPGTLAALVDGLLLGVRDVFAALWDYLFQLFV